jgi:hypothetical protein
MELILCTDWHGNQACLHRAGCQQIGFSRATTGRPWPLWTLAATEDDLRAWRGARCTECLPVAA